MNSPPPLKINYPKVPTLEKIHSQIIHLMALPSLDDAVNLLCESFPANTPEEQDRILDLCPYFGIVWPSARALGLHLDLHRGAFRNQRVLEIGAGLALPSFVGKKIGIDITASDFHPDVKEWLTKNEELNSIQIPYLEWDWNQNLPSDLAHSFDVVIGADVIYERKNLTSLVKAVRNALKPMGRFYLADPGRVYLESVIEDLKPFFQKESEWIYEVEDSGPLPEHRLGKKRPVFVFEFSLKSEAP